MIAAAEKRVQGGNGAAPLGRRYVQTIRFWSLSAEAITVIREDAKSDQGVTINFVCIPRGVHIDQDAPPIELDDPDMPTIPQFTTVPAMPDSIKQMTAQVEEQRAAAIQAAADAQPANVIDATERPAPTTDSDGIPIPPEIQAERAKIDAATAGAEQALAQLRANQAAADPSAPIVIPDHVNNPHAHPVAIKVAQPLVPSQPVKSATHVYRSGELPKQPDQLKPDFWHLMSRIERRRWETNRYGDLLDAGLSAYAARMQASAEVRTFG